MECGAHEDVETRKKTRKEVPTRRWCGELVMIGSEAIMTREKK